MEKYDGWTIKSPKGYFYNYYFRQTKKETIEAFEYFLKNAYAKNLIELGIWQKYRKRGWETVKVKFVEVN